MGKDKLVDLPDYKALSTDDEKSFKDILSVTSRDYYDIVVLLNDGDDISDYINEFNDIYDYYSEFKEKKDEYKDDSEEGKDLLKDNLKLFQLQVLLLGSADNLKISAKHLDDEKNYRNKKFYGGIGGTASILSFSVSSCVCCVSVILVVVMMNKGEAAPPMPIY
jgi:cell shape-determining protein MreC